MSSDAFPVYRIGDSVISLVSLITVPLRPGEIRVEIPTASRGTVIEHRPDDHVHPYTAVFEVGEGGVVQIDVTCEQIAPVSPHEPLALQKVVQLDELPPLVARRPRRPVRYQPTLQYPHRHCPRRHSMIFGLILGAYMLVLLMATLPVLTFTVLMVSVLYGYDLTRYRAFSWVPVALQYDKPTENEKLVIDQRWAGRAALSDFILIAALIGLLAYHFEYKLDDGNVNMVRYVAHLASAGVVMLFKLIAHDKAARIQPK